MKGGGGGGSSSGGSSPSSDEISHSEVDSHSTLIVSYTKQVAVQIGFDLYNYSVEYFNDSVGYLIGGLYDGNSSNYLAVLMTTGDLRRNAPGSFWETLERS